MSNIILLTHILFMEMMFAFMFCLNCKIKDDEVVGINILSSGCAPLV